MGLRYRDELLAKGDGNANVLQARPSQSSSRKWPTSTDSRVEKSTVLMDLLKIMIALPVDAICQSSCCTTDLADQVAVNTLPCISKIRYVASELLGELESPCLVLDPMSGEINPDNHSDRAIGYLCESCAGLLTAR